MEKDKIIKMGMRTIRTGVALAFIGMSSYLPLVAKDIENQTRIIQSSETALEAKVKLAKYEQQERSPWLKYSVMTAGLGTIVCGGGILFTTQYISRKRREEENN